MSRKEPRINGRRLQHTLEEMARVGATPGGGVQRLALSDEDRTARDLFVSWLQEMKLDIVIDEMGNIFGTRPGRQNDLPPVMSGSHIDSQPRGGKFDGILGVMAALEVLRTLDDNHTVTTRPITIVNWTNEEGSRFAPAMQGSGVWTGALDRDWVYDRTDVSGLRFEDELIRIGYKAATSCKKWPVHCYYEYHIEQGPVLEQEAKTIGVPRGIMGLHWYDIYIQGEANHTGATPMPGRRDALSAAAEMIRKVNDIPQRMGGQMVATVGEIHNFPNSRNIIPEKVHFTVDIRAWNDERVGKAWDLLRLDFENIAGRKECRIRIEPTGRVAHAPFDENRVQVIIDCAESLDYSWLPMVSGAAHDATHMSRVCPTAMIFVPSIGGRSHVEVENTSWKDCAAGADVLLHAMLRSANEE